MHDISEEYVMSMEKRSTLASVWIHLWSETIVLLCSRSLNLCERSREVSDVNSIREGKTRVITEVWQSRWVQQRIQFAARRLYDSESYSMQVPKEGQIAVLPSRYGHDSWGLHALVESINQNWIRQTDGPTDVNHLDSCSSAQNRNACTKKSSRYPSGHVTI
jgi:hypothetical protein